MSTITPIPQTDSEKRQDYVIFPRDRYSEALEDAYYEILRARAKHGNKDFGGPHEGYGFLLEKVRGVEDEIRRDVIDLAKKEMNQVAAMAIRFVAEL